MTPHSPIRRCGIVAAGGRREARAAANAWKGWVGGDVDLVIGAVPVLHRASDGKLARQGD